MNKWCSARTVKVKIGSCLFVRRLLIVFPATSVREAFVHYSRIILFLRWCYLLVVRFSKTPRLLIYLSRERTEEEGRFRSVFFASTSRSDDEIDLIDGIHFQLGRSQNNLKYDTAVVAAAAFLHTALQRLLACFTDLSTSSHDIRTYFCTGTQVPVRLYMLVYLFIWRIKNLSVFLTHQLVHIS